MTTRYRSPRRLQPGDDLESFACRSGAQTEWLWRHARQADTTGTSRVFVVTSADRSEVISAGRNVAVAATLAGLEYRR